MARAANGDRKAFEALVLHHQRPLFGFLGRMGLRQPEAEEMAQEAFVRAWQHLPSYRREKGAFSTWLYTIARRLALNELDRAGHRLHHVDHDDDGDGDTTDTACERPGPAQTLHARRQRATLHAALLRIPPADRCTLALAYIHDLSLAEVAQIEGCSAAAVKARLHRARQRLRDELPAFDLTPLE